MVEYSCFLHPQRKGNSLDDKCPDCGESFRFPLTDHPQVINGKKVLSALDRGYYGAVYEVAHQRLRNRTFAVKVMPKGPYLTPRSDGGHGKDFDEECRLHEELSAIQSVASLEDFGEEQLVFGGRTIECLWMELEFVHGRTLEQVLLEGPNDPLEIAQIACDLLEFLAELDQREGRHHNDLHMRNIKIATLEQDDKRRDAIYPYIRTKILDLGSAADRSKSAVDGRMNDTHQVAQHILALVDAYERVAQDIPPNKHYLCARLRQLAQLYCAVDRSRPIRFDDVRDRIIEACEFRGRWWDQQVRVSSIAADYNAASMESFFADELFCDPCGWKNRLLQSGTLILTGMRGCGKTILLRSVDWKARAYRHSDESIEDVQSRLENDQFVGFFVSCATLMRGPHSSDPAQVLRRLFLAYAIEVVRLVQTCQVLRLGQIDYAALITLNALLGKMAPWYVAPNDPHDPFAIESAIIQACNENGVGSDEPEDANPRDLFESLTSAIRSLADVLNNKKVLFLLDDVSVRFLSQDSVDDIFRRLSFQSTDFAFKISSESQTIQMTSPGGGLAQLGRDYEMFDLGDEVFERIRSRRLGPQFVADILWNRSRVLAEPLRIRPTTVLGRQPLVDIARAIHSRATGGRGSKFVYWGLDTLAGICVGDIGDILWLYEHILQAHAADNRNSYPVAKSTQHKAIVNFAERRLMRFAVESDWLHAHAMAFANASHQELVQSTNSRLRQYAEVFVKIDPSQVAALLPKILTLIEQGVFVPTGATPRSKVRSQPFLQLKLAFRKLWGLTSVIPLSMRDRFELSGDKLQAWLESPSVESLSAAERCPTESPNESNDTEETDVCYSDPTLFDEPNAGETAKSAHGTASHLPSPTVLFDVETVFSGAPSELSGGVSDLAIVAGLGFEDRSVGAWRNLLGVGAPARAILLEYAQSRQLNEENARLAKDLLRDSGVDFDVLSVDAVPETEQVDAILRLCGNSRIAIDTTSLTKPLTYNLVRSCLTRRSEAFVLHTCAQEYFPKEVNLEPIRSLLDAARVGEAFRALDEQVEGEVGPYTCVRLGPSNSDPSRPSFMATFVSLKYQPLKQILDVGSLEVVAAIWPEHTTGANATRSVVARYLADYFAMVHRGEALSIKSLDHASAFRELVRLHTEFALEKGYNFDLSLTGTKMHTVAAAMLASTRTLANVWYSRPSGFNPETFTKGTGKTNLVLLKRVESVAAEAAG